MSISSDNSVDLSNSYHKGRIIIVSLKLPFGFLKNDGRLRRQNSYGGLVNCVWPFVVENEGIWIGHPGSQDVASEIEPESDDASITSGLASKHIITVFVENELFLSFYNGCCKGTFWPLFHCMPDLATFSTDRWNIYVQVNKLFADRIIEKLEEFEKEGRENQILWYHDYHLMLVGKMVRNMGKHLKPFKMGFFLHITFPPWDLFKILPWAEEVLQGMLACDMVSFHIRDYCLNFVDCCQRCLGCRVDYNSFLVEDGKRTVMVRPLTIGIPFDKFQDLARSAPLTISTDKKILLGIETIDYTKGILHRLLAIEYFLLKYPEYLEKVILLQISVPSRSELKDYKDLKEQIDQEIGRINGRFSTALWSPIHYIYGNISQEQLCSVYRETEVALVTPLRDGMNLVAKEFVACQIKTPPGVLVVSRFAGTADTMLEALKCNPYEIGGYVDVIHKALTMPEDERTLRMNGLRRREEKYSTHYWTRHFLWCMGTMPEASQVSVDNEDELSTVMHPVTLDDFDSYLSKYVHEGETDKVAFLLHYDEILIPRSSSDMSLTSLIKDKIQNLIKIPDVFTCIISSTSVQTIKERLNIEGLTYAGYHGMEVLYPDGSHFTYPMPKEYTEKCSALLKVLQEKVCKEGAWVETWGAVLILHLENTPENLLSDLVSQAKVLIEDAEFSLEEFDWGLQAKPPDVHWDTGQASIYILRTLFGLDWSERICIIFVGTHTVDDSAFLKLKGMGATFLIGCNTAQKTVADKRLSDPESLATLMEWIERYFEIKKEKHIIK